MNALTEGELRTRLLLSMQRALLGAVTPNLRCVYVRLADKKIYSVFVYEKEPSVVERDAASLAGTEVIADFEKDYGISEQVVVSEAPRRRLDEVYSWPNYWLAYLRMEP